MVLKVNGLEPNRKRTYMSDLNGAIRSDEPKSEIRVQARV